MRLRVQHCHWWGRWRAGYLPERVREWAVRSDELQRARRGKQSAWVQPGAVWGCAEYVRELTGLWVSG